MGSNFFLDNCSIFPHIVSNLFLICDKLDLGRQIVRFFELGMQGLVRSFSEMLHGVVLKL